MGNSRLNIIRYSEIGSTNDHARELLRKEQPEEGTIILADHQTSGKGHDGNSWESDPGENLLMSMILYPKFLAIAKQFYLSMAISLGIVDFLKDLLPGYSFSLKWPNDIYSGDKKLGGVLINNEIMGDEFKHVIAGIGLNVNQINFSSDIPNPVSLKQICNKDLDPVKLARPLADSIFYRIELLKKDPDKIYHDYHQALYAINEWRKFIYKEESIHAMIEGVNEYGHLMLQTDAGKIECEMKEISFVF